MNGFVTGTPKWLLRLEGLSALTAATIAYTSLGTGWRLFALLFLVPDISMAGYLAGRKAGAMTYNIGHSYIGPLIVLAAGQIESARMTLAIGLIWAAHIGFDRALGYGLKYAEGFGFTHLGRIGASRVRSGQRS